MRRLLLSGLAAVASVGFAAEQAPALRIAVQNFSTTQKTAQAQVVVTGKVTGLEKETVELPQFPGDKNKVAFTIAVIKVETGLVGAKNITHIKVAFLVQPGVGTGGGDPAPVVGKPGLIRPIGPGFGPIQLAEGQEGIFFLQKHPGSDAYYTVPQGYTPVSAKAENYKDELAKVKMIADAFADPGKALKAEKLDSRLAATAALVGKYRQNTTGQMVETAIPAEETKLILKTLLEADWTVADMPPPGFDYQLAPSNIAGLLGLYPGANGIPQIIQKPGESYSAKYKEAIKVWYAKAGEKYEIKKFVPKEKK